MAPRGLARVCLLLALGVALGSAAEVEADATAESQEDAADAGADDESAEGGAEELAPAAGAEEGDGGPADAESAEPGHGSGGPDLSQLQDSLRKGGVQGLNKMLKSIQSMGALHSDASLHIKKDASGREMYDFRDVNPAAPPGGANAKAEQASTAGAGEQEEREPAAGQPRAVTGPRAGAGNAAAAAVAAVQAASAESEDNGEGAEGADGGQEGGSQDTDAPAAEAVAAAAAATAAPSVPAASAAPAAPAAAAASAPPVALAVSAAARGPAAPVAAAAPVAERPEGTLAQQQQRPEGEVDLLMRGVLALRQSADELIRKASSSRASPAAAQTDATAQSDLQKQMLLRLDALEKENGEMRQRLDEQSRELVGVEAAERRDQQELQEAKKELAAGQQSRDTSLRGPAASSGAQTTVAGGSEAHHHAAAGRARRSGRVRKRAPARP